MDMQSATMQWEKYAATIILELAGKASPGKASEDTRYVAFTDEEPHFVLEGNAYSAFVKLVEKTLLRNRWGEKFSVEYVLEQTLRLVHIGRSQGPDGVQRALAELTHTLDSWDKKTKVYIPVFGIDLQVERLELGDVCIRKVTEDDVSGIRLHANTIELLTQAYLGTEGPEWYVGKACSVHSIVAEPIRAKERATADTERVIEMLSYGAYSFARRGFDLPFAMDAESYRSPRNVLAVAAGERKGKSFVVPPTLPEVYTINEEAVTRLERNGVFRLAQKFVSPNEDRNDSFTKSLLNAVHWFSVGNKQANHETRFLSYVIALESILLPDQSSIAESVAAGTAWLIGKDFDEREVWHKQVKDCYRKRSKIAHGTKSQVLLRDVYVLQYVTWHVIRDLTKRLDDFASTEDLRKHLHKLKLGYKGI